MATTKPTMKLKPVPTRRQVIDDRVLEAGARDELVESRSLAADDDRRGVVRAAALDGFVDDPLGGFLGRGGRVQDG